MTAMRIEATWFDAGSSRRQAATLWFEGGALHVENESGETRTTPLGELKMSARLGSLPRQLHLPDGVLLSVEDNDAIDNALADAKKGAGGAVRRRGGWVHWMESQLRWAAVLLVAAGGVVYLGYAQGLPAASVYVAEVIPDEYIRNITEEVYDNLHYQDILHETKLSDLQQKRAHLLFDKVKADVGEVRGDLRLRLNRFSYFNHYDDEEEEGEGEPNAFAFPDGLVVITDEMMRLLDDDEIIAVIAHEVGHVHHNHSMRGLVQAVGAATFVFFLLGDFSFLSTVPVALANLKYSRDFEREADCFAHDYLVAQGMSPALLGDALQKLEDHAEQQTENLKDKWREAREEVLGEMAADLAEKRDELEAELQEKSAQLQQMQEAEEKREAFVAELEEGSALRQQYEEIEALEAEDRAARRQALEEDVVAIEAELSEVREQMGKFEAALVKSEEQVAEEEGEEEEEDSALWAGFLEAISTHPKTDDRVDLSVQCS